MYLHTRGQALRQEDLESVASMTESYTVVNGFTTLFYNQRQKMLFNACLSVRDSENGSAVPKVSLSIPLA
jgi:hypothetical protein